MWTDNDSEVFDKAVRAKNSGDLSTSIMLVSALISRYPTRPRLFWYLGHLFQEMGSLEQAIDSFRRATNLAPEMEWASLGLFHCLWNHNKLEEAFAEMQRFMVDNDSSLYKELMKTLDELGADPKRVDDDIIREFRAVIAQEKIEGKEKTL